MDLSNRPKLTYSVPEAAKVLGVSASKMYEVVRIKGFPTIKVGKLYMEILAQELHLDEIVDRINRGKENREAVASADSGNS